MANTGKAARPDSENTHIHTGTVNWLTPFSFFLIYETVKSKNSERDKAKPTSVLRFKVQTMEGNLQTDKPDTVYICINYQSQFFSVHYYKFSDWSPRRRQCLESSKIVKSSSPTPYQHPGKDSSPEKQKKKKKRKTNYCSQSFLKSAIMGFFFSFFFSDTKKKNFPNCFLFDSDLRICTMKLQSITKSSKPSKLL